MEKDIPIKIYILEMMLFQAVIFLVHLDFQQLIVLVFMFGIEIQEIRKFLRTAIFHQED